MLSPARCSLLLRLILLMLVAAVPLAFLAHRGEFPAQDYVLQPKTAVAMLGALVACAVLVMDGRFRRQLAQPLFIPLAALAAAGVLAMPHAANVPQALRLLGEQLGWAALCLAATVSAPAWGKLLLVTAVSVAAQLVIALMQLQGWWVVGHGEQFGPSRIYATLGNPSFFGVYLAPVAVWLLAGLVSAWRQRSFGKAGWVGAALVATIFLMIKAAVIDAWVGFALGGALAVWLMHASPGRPRTRCPVRSFALPALVLVFGCLVALQVLMPRLHDRLAYLKVKAFSWHAAAWLWRDHPVTGAGLGGYQTFAPLVMARVHRLWTSDWGVRETVVMPHDEAFAHQDFAQRLAETGVLGFGAWVWLLVVVVRTGWRDPSRAPYLGALTAFVPTMCFHFPLHLASSTLLFWLCVGWAGRYERSLPLFLPSAVNGEKEKGAGVRYLALVSGLIILVLLAVLVTRGLTANVYLGSGYRLFRGGALRQAVPLFENFRRLAPYHFEGAFYAGALYQALGDHGRAIEGYERAIKLYPGMQGAIYNLGNVYFKRGHYAQAIETFTRAIAINPCLVEAINNRGNAYSLHGQFEKADRDYLRAVALNPSYPDALFNLAVSALRKGDSAAARRWLTRTLDVDPGYKPAAELADSLELKLP